MKRTTDNRFGNRKSVCQGRNYLIPFLILLLTACGTTLVNIRVDVSSFLSDDELSIDYGTAPVIPGNGPAVTIQTPVEIIPMPEEINQVTDINAIEIRTLVEFRNETGEATIIYRIFFNRAADDIFDTPPVVDERVELIPGTITQNDILIEGDYRLIDLFENDEIAVASMIEVNPGESEEDIAGEVELMELTVRITAVGERE